MDIVDKVKKHLNKIVLVCSLILMLGIFSSHSNKIHAQSSVGLSVSPPTFELTANPGDFLFNTIRVDNLSDVPISVIVDKRNFTAMGEEGAVSLMEGENQTYTLASWISVTPTQATIPAKRSVTFNYDINVPLNAEPGGHFGSIVFVSGGQTPGETGAAVSQELGALLLLKVAGNIREEGQVASFEADKGFWEFGPVTFSTRVKNEGNVHFRTLGYITIRNMFGTEIERIEIEPRNVLPEATRRLSSEWDVRYGFGKYTATAHLTYGNKGELLTSQSTFIVFPYKMGIAAGFIVLVFLVLIYKARRRLSTAVRVLLGKQNV
jgi:hypothetical protein